MKLFLNLLKSIIEVFLLCLDGRNNFFLCTRGFYPHPLLSLQMFLFLFGFLFGIVYNCSYWWQPFPQYLVNSRTILQHLFYFHLIFGKLDSLMDQRWGNNGSSVKRNHLPFLSFLSTHGKKLFISLTSFHLSMHPKGSLINECCSMACWVSQTRWLL